MKYWGFVLGCMLVILAVRLLEQHLNKSNYNTGDTVTIRTQLLTDPTLQGNTQRIFIRHLSKIPLYVILPRFPEYQYGDTLSIKGTISDSRMARLSSLNTRVINNKNPFLTVYFPEVEVEKKTDNWPLALATSIRQKIMAAFHSILPQQSSSLLLGITLGIRDSMSKDFRNQLQNAGVTHVVAASGMNVTVLAGFVSSMFTRLVRRQIAVAITIGSIMFYCLLSGFEPSIIRASIMGIAVFSAQIFGRQVMALYTLFLAGYAIILISPFVIYDIGFQLSFVSTLGLLFIRPLFEQSTHIQMILKRIIIGDDIATTISAQLAALPVLLSNFGTYSPVSILVNGLVLWTVPFLMVIGGVCSLSVFVVPFLTPVLLYLSLPLLWYFEWVVGWFSGGNQWNGFDGLHMSIYVGYYLVLGALVLLVRKREQ